MSLSPTAEVELLEVRTGCRLHFGLMELCPSEALRYAGLGLMLDRPGWQLRFTHERESLPNSCAQEIDRPDANQRVADQQGSVQETLEFRRRIEHVRALWQPTAEADRRVSIQLLSSLPLHAGLGAGTQLASAVAVGLALATAEALPTQSKRLTEWKSLSTTWSDLTACALSRLAGRGLRSAIGLQGFLSGGLVLDHGCGTTDKNRDGLTRSIATEQRWLTDSWRVVLIEQSAGGGVAGEREAAMIGQLGKHPNPHAPRMLDLAGCVMDNVNDFGQFTASIEDYMRLAGELFAPVQGGLYNGHAVAAAVAAARAAGLVAVGQSSWGPSVFGFAEDADEAARMTARLERDADRGWKVGIYRAACHGALVRTASGSA
jgi:beta-ribofuranosylaminobenzene 5'-phosphate synthase